jgi:membrane protein
MKSLLKKVEYISEKLNKDHINEYAAECAYFTILSFIPFIIFFLTLIQFTSVDKESIFFCIREIVPSTMQDMVLGIIEEVYAKSVGTISVAAIVALWSASKGFYYLSKGLRKIYNSEKQKITPIIRIEGLIYTLVFIIAIIVFLVIMVFGKRIHNIMLEKFKTVSVITGFIMKTRGLVLILVMFFVFLIIYRVIPKHKMKIKTQIYGAIFSSVAWYFSSWCFSIYIDVFQGFTNTYGSLTSIILVMMWVYTCMYIILLGAEINTLVCEYKAKKVEN